MRKNKLPGFWTHDDQAAKDGVGHLYYFAPDGRAKPPYTHQRHVPAIIDVADDGTLAGVELIDDMPPPPAPSPDAYPIPFNMLSRGQQRYLANRGYQMKVPRSRKRIEYEAVVAARDGNPVRPCRCGDVQWIKEPA